MTAPALSIPRSFDGEALLKRLTPAEGWATLVAVAALSMSFAWSLDDAGWIPSLQGSTGYLSWLALLATVVGIVLAKLGVGRLRTDILGSIAGGLFLPFVVGSIVLANHNPDLSFEAIIAFICPSMPLWPSSSSFSVMVWAISSGVDWERPCASTGPTAPIALKRTRLATPPKTLVDVVMATAIITVLSL